MRAAGRSTPASTAGEAACREKSPIEKPAKAEAVAKAPRAKKSPALFPKETRTAGRMLKRGTEPSIKRKNHHALWTSAHENRPMSQASLIARVTENYAPPRSGVPAGSTGAP